MVKYKKEFIIIHHSLSPDSATRNWDAMRRYHVEVNKWRDIGYHYGVELVGDKYVVQKGRDEPDAGAHCKEAAMNYLGLGVCIVGNFDKEKPLQAQLEVAADLCADLCQRHNIPVGNVRPHRQYALSKWTGEPYKTCPGQVFPMDVFRSMVEVRLRQGDTAGGNTTAAANIFPQGGIAMAEQWKVDIVNEAKEAKIITQDHDPDEKADKWFVLKVALNAMKAVKENA